MSLQLPDSPDRFLQSSLAFRAEIAEIKRENALRQGNWYPFDTLSCLPIVTELFAKDYADIMASISSAPVADLGCGDGDFALLFARWGVAVDALDYPPNNYNRMEGINALASALGLSVRTFDLDLNNMSRLPSEVYGLTIFLGTLYHLKNPYGVLENLAHQTRWCILSTRIAQVTPSAGSRMESEPVAYLADGREIENDATNYWIFSYAGLLRILQRTRWAIAAIRRIGCSVDSNPIDPDADERMFVLLRSRVHFPNLQVALLEGWHRVEQNYRWTAKTFSIELVLPLETPLSGFSLRILIPTAILGTDGILGLSCTIKSRLVGDARYDGAGSHVFRGALPPFALHEPILTLRFSVDSDFSSPSGDIRELGLCVPVTGPGHQIDFRVF
jgi:tRNA (mo5U34)-methyltransferase